MSAKRELFVSLGLAILTLTGGYIVYSKTRGLRNNNPGNIRLSSTVWQGQSSTQTDPAFVQFDTPEAGIRALARIIKNDFAAGRNTIAAIITRWAPPTENNTGAYISAVATAAGIDPYADASGHLVEIVKGIISHENGINPYSDSTIIAGVNAA